MMKVEIPLRVGPQLAYDRPQLTTHGIHIGTAAAMLEFIYSIRL
jgi:hypothetical protein